MNVLKKLSPRIAHGCLDTMDGPNWYSTLLGLLGIRCLPQIQENMDTTRYTAVDKLRYDQVLDNGKRAVIAFVSGIGWINLARRWKSERHTECIFKLELD
jgi:hypothetical protein